MYLVLMPVHKLNGAQSEYYEASYLKNPVEISRALEREGVVVYKLDELKEIRDIKVTCKERVVNARERR